MSRGDRAEEILDAAFESFLALGVRRTTIEEIASRALLSRPGVYQYFPDKESIFLAVLSRIHRRTIDTAEAILAGDLPIQEALVAAFDVKYRIYIDTVSRSVHANELFDTSDTVATELNRKGHDRFLRLVEAALKRAVRRNEINLQRVGLTAASAASLIDDAITGVLHASFSKPKSWPTRLRSTVNLILQGIGEF